MLAMIDAIVDATIKVLWDLNYLMLKTALRLMGFID